MTHRNFPSESYVYTADGERLANLRYTSGTSFGSETWTMRGLDGKVLRRWEHSLQPAGTLLFADGFETGNTSAWDTTVGAFASPPPSSSTASGMVAEIPTKGDFNGTQGTWLWTKDYIYRNGVMLAAATNESGNDATIHFAVNHLGTPQVTTNAIGQVNEIAHYWGFGGLAGNTEPGNETQRFTGHERDFHLNDNENDDLDYMHARYCSPHLRRFLSVDPAQSSAKPGVPQSWNRYSYALNNPVRFVDPDGESFKDFARGLGRGFVTGAVVTAVALGAIAAAPAAAPLVAAAGLIGLATVAVEGHSLLTDPLTTAAQKHEFAGEVTGLIVGAGTTAGVARVARSGGTGKANPLEGATYTGKVRQQIRPNQRTGTTDNHGFPLVVDNFAGRGTTRQITGGDGVVRTRVELSGSYRGKEGTFEWIVEPDGTVNHRLFVAASSE